MKTITGRRLNREWSVGANHALYRKDGRWYHQLVSFPGALFDSNGYVLFRTETDYVKCPYLRIKERLHVPEGIAAIPGYIRVRG